VPAISPSRERDFYRTQLLDNILPFWLAHARDDECGGYFTCLGRDGSVYDQDKNNTWTQGRIAWVFARLYNDFERDPNWLDMARLGVEFLRRFGHDETGRVYYALARDGAPLMPAKDVFSDLFVASAFAEYAVAVGDTDLFATAKTMVFRMADLIAKPEVLTQIRDLGLLDQALRLQPEAEMVNGVRFGDMEGKMRFYALVKDGRLIHVERLTS